MIKKTLCLVVAIGILGYAAIGSIFCSLTAALNHDEHQFMASAAMVAQHGMQPYRDFAYFQMPNLVYVYALFFTTGHPFLAARLFNGACGFALSLSIFLVARKRFRHVGELSATTIAAMAAVLLPSTISFQYAASKVWNHSSATLCAVLAFFAQSKAMRERRDLYFALSGFALGMAIGIRLTFAPLVLPFLLSILFSKAPARVKGSNIAAFTGGGVLANVPALYFCLTNCRDFIFGMFRYRQLDPEYLRSLPEPPAAMDLGDKLYSLLDWLRHDNASVVIVAMAIIGLIVRVIARVKGKREHHFETGFLLQLLPFLLIGYLVPTPAQFQYSFTLAVFLLLFSVHALSTAKIDNRIFALLAIIALVAILIFDAARTKKTVVMSTRVLQPTRWVPLQIENRARWIREQIPANARAKVLTLSPIYVIEAGLPIYKEFVTGPFAWRVSHLVSQEEAAARKLPWSPGIREFLQNDPPAAVLTGLESKPELEAPLIREIESMNYRRVDVPGGGVLWQK